MIKHFKLSLVVYFYITHIKPRSFDTTNDFYHTLILYNNRFDINQVTSACSTKENITNHLNRCYQVDDFDILEGLKLIYQVDVDDSDIFDDFNDVIDDELRKL